MRRQRSAASPCRGARERDAGRADHHVGQVLEGDAASHPVNGDAPAYAADERRQHRWIHPLLELAVRTHLLHRFNQGLQPFKAKRSAQPLSSRARSERIHERSNVVRFTRHHLGGRRQDRDDPVQTANTGGGPRFLQEFLVVLQNRLVEQFVLAPEGVCRGLAPSRWRPPPAPSSSRCHSRRARRTPVQRSGFASAAPAAFHPLVA